MVLIFGIATTAAGALMLHRQMQGGAFGDPRHVVRVVRQTTGVVLAVANFVRAVMDALQLINRPAAAAATTSTGLRVIGARAED